MNRRVAAELQNSKNEIWLSPISIWETMILAEKGRIVLQRDPASWVRTVLNQLAFHEARINHEIALQSRALKLRYQDPADRFLAATAMVYQLTLVRADKTLFACRDISVLQNQTGAGHRNVPKA